MHAIWSLKERRFDSRGAAATAVLNFEMEFNPFERGWIITGPGFDRKFRVHQGCVDIVDIPELLVGNGVWFLLNGKASEFDTPKSEGEEWKG